MTGYDGNTIYVHDPGFNISSYDIEDIVTSGIYTYIGPE